MKSIDKLHIKALSLNKRVKQLADEDGVWRTVRGRKIFIKKGEDLDSALDRYQNKSKAPDARKQRLERNAKVRAENKSKLKANEGKKRAPMTTQVMSPKGPSHPIRQTEHGGFKITERSNGTFYIHDGMGRQMLKQGLKSEAEAKAAIDKKKFDIPVM